MNDRWLRGSRGTRHPAVGDSQAGAADVNPTRLSYRSPQALVLVVVDMDVVKAVETYITKMVAVPSAMKVLLLDSHTVRYSAL
jgi:hypothetical protein